MGQYAYRVEKQRLMLEAEEWAGSIKTIHTHSINSMWYDTRPEDTEGGKMVTDYSYNDGIIKRTQNEVPIWFFGTKLKGENLLDAYLQSMADGGHHG